MATFGHPQSHYSDISDAWPPVAAAEQREAAIERAALANMEYGMGLKHRVAWFCDCCAVDRSLALLGSGYRARVAEAPGRTVVRGACFALYSPPFF
ncbi:hypothetical protein EMIT0373P_50126 [Pseudomonas chlororaphis]